jgi:hypothetical protein
MRTAVADAHHYISIDNMQKARLSLAPFLHDVLDRNALIRESVRANAYKLEFAALHTINSLHGQLLFAYARTLLREFEFEEAMDALFALEEAAVGRCVEMGFERNRGWLLRPGFSAPWVVLVLSMVLEASGSKQPFSVHVAGSKAFF